MLRSRWNAVNPGIDEAIENAEDLFWRRFDTKMHDQGLIIRFAVALERKGDGTSRRELIGREIGSCTAGVLEVVCLAILK